MSMDVKALRAGYDSVGMEILIGHYQLEQEEIVQSLLVVGNGPQSEKLNDFQRGRHNALEEVITTIRAILKP